MKTFLILVALILFLNTPALAGPGSIMVLADPSGTDCGFVDNGGLVQVYFFHAFTTGDILAVDCSNPGVLIFPTGDRGIANQNQSCMCSVPVEETTWGQIKAQYQ